MLFEEKNPLDEKSLLTRFESGCFVHEEKDVVQEKMQICFDVDANQENCKKRTSWSIFKWIV